jgi:2Fe-2S iron-sulfur cluster binding domain
MKVRFSVNAQQLQLDIEPRRTLADVIRENCGLNGTHLGCEDGVCGACTVLVDDSTGYQGHHRRDRSGGSFGICRHGQGSLTVRRGSRLPARRSCEPTSCGSMFWY